MKLQFLGTGAADFDWSRIGEEGVRGSTSTLIDGHILIDAGVTGWENLLRSDIDPSCIDTLLITHSHDDHFREDVIARILSARKKNSSVLRFFASPQAVDRLKKVVSPESVELFSLTSGTEFDIPGSYRVVTLPANHRVDDFREECFHFLFLSEKENLLYALDGAWMTTKARFLIGKRHIHTVVWESTMQNAGNFRIFEHSDLTMLDQMRRVLSDDGVFDSSTEFFLTHIARTLWVPDRAEQDASAAAHGYRMMHDGDSIVTRR